MSIIHIHQPQVYMNQYHHYQHIDHLNVCHIVDGSECYLLIYPRKVLSFVIVCARVTIMTCSIYDDIHVIDITALSDLFDKTCRLQDDLQDYLLGTRPASVSGTPSSLPLHY
jgi:hypothetical protein